MISMIKDMTKTTKNEKTQKISSNFIFPDESIRMENEEEAETVGDEVTANTENFNCDSHLLERVVIMMETIWQSIITTT